MIKAGQERRRRVERLQGASAEQLSRLLSLGVRFKRFREELKSKPEAAAARCGIKLSKEQAEIMRTYDGVLAMAEMREALQKNCKVVKIAVLT